VSNPRALIIDDETAILDTLRILLKREGFEVHTAASGQQGLDALPDVRPDFVLTDIRMPAVSGIDILNAAREMDPTLPVILMTAQASLHSAIQAVNQGAFHYIQKPFSNDDMLVICRRAVESRELKRENQALKKEIRRRDAGEAGRPAGKSRSFVDVLKLAETVAPTDSTLLISGESGTGKEVIARYVHTLSDRSAGPFVSINCGALPESLLESELFGHIKGSFTGAIRDKQGLFVAARAGTFFLDEVGEMTPATQVKVLRAVQEREVVPVGATEPIAVDVRIIAATNRDLEEEIRRGAFRSDLYYRLNVITLHMPPLRDRIDDVPILAEFFLDRFAATRGKSPPRLSADALAALNFYDWPGNVRELENALERAAVLSGDGEIAVSALPSRITSEKAQPLVSDRLPPNPQLEIIERAYILWVLQSEGGNKTKAAEVLGIDPSTLYRKLVRYGIQE
jgi:DNA-binding NtrC family response regulator